MSDLAAPKFDSMNTAATRFSHFSPPDSMVDAQSISHDRSTLTEPLRQTQHHHSNSLQSLSSRSSRRSLAILAREKTSTALATLASISTPSNPPLRSVTSSDNIYRQSRGFESNSGITSRPPVPRNVVSSSDIPSVTHLQRRSRASGFEHPLEIPRSVTPSMARPEHAQSKMHQTSSKILRMTEDDRPFTKDFQDLFATLVTSLPLTPHRVRFSRVEETFLSEEAITNLGSLKFSQSNRIPDPKNPSRWVVTTTTTTFSMAKEMARSVCQRFLDARLIESAESRSVTVFPLKGGVWQLTPKGMYLLNRFCSRNGINARHVEPLIRREQMQLVTLERDTDSDKLSQDKGTIEVIFRRFAGQEGPNLKNNVQISDSDSVSDYATGLVGVKMARERRISDKTVLNSFTGKAASDWLLDCCTTVDRRETSEIADMFVKWQLIAAVVEDKAYIKQYPGAVFFQPTKSAIYVVTEKGQRLCGWLARDPSISSNDSNHDHTDRVRGPKDSNHTRLIHILQDPALRLLFKEFLRMSLCEENLTFYLDVKEFTGKYRHLERNGRIERPDAVREALGGAYGLYNAFLASGAPSELNIDHSLRNRLDNRMIRTDSNDDSMRASLCEVVELFELAQVTVFKLMASDSVPKFMRDPRYASVLREHEWDLSANRPSSPLPGQGL